MIENNMDSLFPIFLKLKNRNCMVIGGGKIGARKVEDLLQSGAIVTVISPEISPELNKINKEQDVNILERSYQSGDLKDFFLVIDATGDMEVAQQVVNEARNSGILVNVVDNPDF